MIMLFGFWSLRVVFGSFVVVIVILRLFCSLRLWGLTVMIPIVPVITTVYIWSRG